MTAQTSVKRQRITLQPQHKLFAEEYLKYGKISASARAAGYVSNSAHVTGNKLLKRPDVKAYLAQRAEELSSQEDNSLQQRVITELEALAFASIADFITVDDDGLPQVDFSNATPEQLRAVSSIKTKRFDKYNKDGERIGTETQSDFSMADKYRGLELLGKHLGLFKEAEQRVVLDVADRLLAARQRILSIEDDSGGGG